MRRWFVRPRSTWGTPLFFDAHSLGIDISIHAATKYIGGHSDIMLGLTTGSYDALASTREWCVCYGSTAAPDVCWLGLRGLGASWGGFESLVLPAVPHDQRAAGPSDEGRLVRLHIGLEDPRDLIADLDDALGHL